MATHRIFLSEGKSPVAQAEQTKGLSYESVMVLVDGKILGTGYKLYVDNFYTSPSLFRDLLQKGIWACGTIHSNLVGFPQATDNRLPRNAPHGSMRWIRNDKLLFVEWKGHQGGAHVLLLPFSKWRPHSTEEDEDEKWRMDGADCSCTCCGG